MEPGQAQCSDRFHRQLLHLLLGYHLDATTAVSRDFGKCVTIDLHRYGTLTLRLANSQLRTSHDWRHY